MNTRNEEIVAQLGRKYSEAMNATALDENGRAVAQAEKDRPGIGAEFHCLFDAEQHARSIRFLLYQERVAVDHIGAGVALTIQREQFFVIGAQMRGAIQNVGDESGLS